MTELTPDAFEHGKGARLSKEQIDFLEKNKISFTELAREAVNKKMNKTKENNKQKKREYIMGNIVVLGLGIIFMFWIATPRTFLAWIVVFSIGLFCCIYGLFNIFSVLKINPFTFYKKVIQNRRK